MTGRLALLFCSVLVALGLLEIGCRLVRGPETLLDWRNIVRVEREATRAAGTGRLVHDPELGFVTAPGYRSPDVNYDSDGHRIAPSPAGRPLAEPPILVVGDSYAHGDEVADTEAWPALLQGLTGRRTVNAGVSGYGLDQSVLRAEAETAKVHPAAIVLVFIAEDLRRSEMKRVWGAEKPYVTRSGDRLVLHNQPVPPPPRPADTLDIWQRLFGWSVLVDTLLRHKGWQYEWSIDHERVLPRGTGASLACPLLARLKSLDRPVVVVASYDPYVWRDADYARSQRDLSQRVLDCARQSGFSTIDLFDPVDAAVRRLGYAAVFRSSHPGPVGHEIAAEKIAAAIATLHIPPR